MGTSNKKVISGPDGVALMVGALSLYTKKLQGLSPVRVCEGGKRSMFLSNVDVSLSLSLPASTLFKMHKTYPQVRIFKKRT